MKKRAMAIIAGVLVTASLSLGTTFAWLNAQTQPLKNTFTVGQIGLTLDEALTERNVVVGEERTTSGNTYSLYQGAMLDKDPTVTVEAGSESCYVFMSCDVSPELNKIIEKNMDTTHWIFIGDNVYVYSETGDKASIVNYKEENQVLPPLFTKVFVRDDCTSEVEAADNSIVVKALAYQSNDESTYEAACEFAKEQLSK